MALRWGSINSTDELANLSYASWYIHYLQVWWSYLHSPMDDNPLLLWPNMTKFCTPDQANPGTIPNQPAKRPEQCHKEAFTKDQSRNDMCHISMDESTAGSYPHQEQEFLNSFFPFRFSKGQCEHLGKVKCKKDDNVAQWGDKQDNKKSAV